MRDEYQHQDNMDKILLILLCFIAFCSGNLFQIIIRSDLIEATAIKHNAAHYEVNKITGKVYFIWNNEVKPKE